MASPSSVLKFPSDIDDASKENLHFDNQRFLVLPNFHSCLYNSIKTQYMFSIS